MTLLLGPPGCGKTTLLSALSDNLSHSLKVSGEVSYSGYRLDEFDDLHLAEMTVRETIDFFARCQGARHRAGKHTLVTKKWENKQLLKQLSSPSVQRISIFLPVCLKMNLSLLEKSFLSFLCAMSPLYGILKKKNQQDLFNIVGALFISALLFGQRVLYRERFAGMYSPWPYSFAQILTLHVVVEVPYLFIRAIIYSMLCNLLYFNHLGMLVVALSPNVQAAYILTSSSYSMLNLFFGFNIPKPWWMWVYYLFPTSWAINGMLTSRHEDLDEEISAFSESKTVSTVLDDYFGFDHDLLDVVGIVLLIFPIVFAFLFAYFIGKLNFQRR
ncbi:hypothetical protein KPL71_027898 [Citrus sinensis]|uniref:Uncharacterized protein n=1 Tax=Citrus sinensis TaxID=2711 RepID=A0ACB8IAV6_CITSI|nr:hypothetical protein KPL71_027898 [Citrus sinensis]